MRGLKPRQDALITPLRGGHCRKGTDPLGMKWLNKYLKQTRSFHFISPTLARTHCVLKGISFFKNMKSLNIDRALFSIARVVSYLARLLIGSEDSSSQGMRTLTFTTQTRS